MLGKMAEDVPSHRRVPAIHSVLQLHIAVMCFGLAGVLGQFVHIPSVGIAGGRVVWSSLALLALSCAKKRDLRLQSKKDYAVALATGVVLAVHWTTFFQSIRSASVAIGTITFSAFPLFLTFLEPLVFHEPLRRRSVVTALLMLLGVGITVPAFSLENQVTVGILWGLVCALSYAVLSLANRYLSCRYAAGTICLYEQGTAAVVLLPALFLSQVSWTPYDFAGIAVLGLVCTALAHSLYVAAQRHVKAQTAGIISGMETVYGILFAFLFLGEVPACRELVGGAVILGVALFSSLSTSACHQKGAP